MNIQEKWAEDLTLKYVESYETESTEEYIFLTKFKMAFRYYDCNYEVIVNVDDFKPDLNRMDVSGDSKLFDSFLSLMERNYTDKIQSAYEDFDSYFDQINNQVK